MYGNFRDGTLLRAARVSDKKSNAAVAASLLLAIFLWGGNNTGARVIVGIWPPILTGGTRFLAAGLILLAVLRWTNWLGEWTSPDSAVKWRLWWQGGLSLAVYIAAFNWALRFTSAPHVALYLAASPVWALLWEDGLRWKPGALLRYGAASLALAGVFIQFWPTLRAGGGNWKGEAFGLAASILWAVYGVQCRGLAGLLPNAHVTAHTMWRAGLLLLIMAVFEPGGHHILWRADLVWIQAYCIVFGAVAAFGLWNSGLRHWPASQVLLFNNLIPISTMAWSHYWLHEPVTRTFWAAVVMVCTGVVTSQIGAPARVVPPE